MPNYFPNDFFKDVSLRKKHRQLEAILHDICSKSALSRIKTNLQMPSAEALDDLLEKFGIPMDDYFCPFLINQTLEAIVMRENLMNCLENLDEAPALAEAKRLLNKFSKLKGFEKGINRQFIISCQTRVQAFEGINSTYFRAQIHAGIAITFPEFNEKPLSGEVLIFEESELVHSLALTYVKEGKPEAAINLLQGVVKGIEILQEDDREKEKFLSKVLLTLSRCYTEQKKFAKALVICERGLDNSLKRCSGKYSPDFAYVKAVCLFYLGRQEESGYYFKLAYFCFALFHKIEQAAKVKDDAERLFNFSVETYGVEKIHFAPRQYGQSLYGEQPLHCKHMGDVIGYLRAKAGMTRKELCNGICHESVLCKIEMGEDKNPKNSVRGIKQPSVYILEALMQRLGRDINLYYNAFLPKRTFDELQMRNEIRALLTMWKFDEAEEILNRLKTSKDYQKGVNRQFVLSSEATITARKEGHGEKYFELINEALKITIPDFDPKRIEQYHLTHDENVLINKMAVGAAENQNRPYAIELFMRLRNNMDANYIDESEKIRTYIMILYNLSKYLGLEGKYYKALDVIEDGEVLAVRNGRLMQLPGLAINKACNLYELGNKEESLPYLAMAYYGAALVGKNRNMINTNNTAKDLFGFEFH